MTGGHKKRQKAKGKLQKLTIKVPSTPNGALESMSAGPQEDKDATTQDPQSSMTSPSPFRTPPTSPSTPAPTLPSVQPLMEQHSVLSDPVISANDIASNEILAIADVFATMKTALVSMTSAFDRLGSQTGKLMDIASDMKTAHQLRLVQSTLEDQIERQKVEIEGLRSSLQDKIKDAVQNKVREEMYDMLKGTIQQQIEEKVRQQLAIQIPEDLRHQVISHKRQILEVKASLHNSEARRYNGLQTIPGPNARLRPLLRPLPTPEQSPIILISSPNTAGDLTAPASAMPEAPAPTPIKRSVSNSLKSAIPDTVPPTPSQIFPRDLSALFALSQEEARRLLREYGLDSATASPARESAKPRALASVDEEVTESEEEDPDAHAKDLNTFMAHIGVPFLMIPAPKEKKDESAAPMSARTRRRRLLTPLIIK